MAGLLDLYFAFFGWLARRLYGPMPSTGHLTSRQHAQLREALFARISRRTWLTAAAVIILGPALLALVLNLRWLWLPVLLLAACVIVVPVVIVLAYGRERRALVEELRRARLLTHCPHCGYDLRATPGRCPECGDAAEPANMRA